MFNHYQDPYHKRVAKAGFVEKTAEIGNIHFNYAEGPKNGPTLLLLHAQHMDWFSYSRVLPELSQSFHIFAVDYHGHGKTIAPVASMNANQIGNDLTQLIKTVIKEPVFISGNSSGGVLTAWLAANEPDWVKAIILEDPALLSSECPRLYSTIADKSFSMCSEFLCQGDQDFLLYWIGQCRDFFKKYVGFDIAPILTASIQHYRKYNPDKPVEIFYLPSIVRLMIRGMSCYDPHFGAAFHENTWNAGFDHAETLTRIQCPALLLHAKTEIMEDGTLNGAMSQEEADRIVTLIPNCKYLKVDSLHVIHIDKSLMYIQILKDFFNGNYA
ncbi:MAG: alpha/beta fold hydrolase [Roseburia sp.]